MISHDADREFQRFVHARGRRIASMTPRLAVEEMASFYREVRAEDVDITADGDMLLFQWGTHDLGDGPWFDFDIARQLYLSGEDVEIWQLHLTFRFEPIDELRVLGNGSRWCHSDEELAEFLEFVRSSRVFREVGDRVDVEPELSYEDV